MKKRKIGFIAAITVLVASAVAAVVLLLIGAGEKDMSPKWELRVNGERMVIGSSISKAKFLEKFGLSVELEQYHFIINSNPTDYEARSENDEICIELLPAGEDEYIVGCVIITGEEIEADICGLKIGDPIEKIKETIPKADFMMLGAGRYRYYVFYVDSKGNIISTADFEKRKIDAKEDGTAELKRLADEYISVKISCDVTAKYRGGIDEIRVSGLRFEEED